MKGGTNVNDTPNSKALKKEKALIDKNIEIEYVEFNRYLKKYSKVKYQHLMPSVQVRLEPVIQIMEQNYGDCTQDQLQKTKSQLQTLITTYNKLVYADDARLNEVEAAVFSEALYMMRRTKDIIFDEIIAKQRALHPVQNCYTSL